MSNHKRKQQVRDSASTMQAMLAKAGAEMVNGYIEIEVEGLTFRRLVCIYAVGLREGWQRTLQGMRSLLRLHPAH